MKKVAIVYDRVNKFGGAERVLLTLHEMFPDAPLYTSVYNPETAEWAKVFPKIYTSFLQYFKFARNNHQFFGWLMPLAFESFSTQGGSASGRDFDQYNLVISVTSEAAKGIITGTNTKHVCYMLTPTRYLWSGYDFYFNNIFFKLISLPVVNYLRWWDKVAAQRPDKIIAISSEVQKRIKKYYNCDSEVIFPPASAMLKALRAGPPVVNKNYFLIHGRFEPYKRLDLVIDAFKSLNYDLVVSGSGTDFNKYKNIKYKNIKFIEKPTDVEVYNLYQNAKAFLMPQNEDFGITSIEAQSFGVPVIAYKSGGALDTVINNKTGVFFDEQTALSLKKAIAKFDTMRFNDGYLRNNAKRFSKELFKKRFLNLLKNNI